jgi:hypothetical protein
LWKALVRDPEARFVGVCIAPNGTVVNMLDYRRGEMFDSGKVCSSSTLGFFFVQTSCPTFKNAQFLVRQFCFITSRSALEVLCCSGWHSYARGVKVPAQWRGSVQETISSYESFPAKQFVAANICGCHLGIGNATDHHQTTVFPREASFPEPIFLIPYCVTNYTF